MYQSYHKLIGCETINIPEIFSGVHGIMGKTVSAILKLINNSSSLKQRKS